MKDRKPISFGANEAQNLIDTTYNAKDFTIPNKSQNAYLMPEGMKRDIDCIDSRRFYEGTLKFGKN